MAELTLLAGGHSRRLFETCDPSLAGAPNEGFRLLPALRTV